MSKELGKTDTPTIFFKLKQVFRWIHRHFNLIAIVLIGCLTVIALVQAYLLGWTQHYQPGRGSWGARSAYVNQGVRSLLHMSLFNIFMASAGLGLLAFVATPFCKRIGIRVKLLWTFTLVFILVFGVKRVDITNNFYGSRYFLPVLIPCLLILLALTLKRVAIFRKLIIPTITIAFIINGMTIGQGFFLGDNYLKKHLLTNLSNESEITLHGSKWLRYMVYPILLNRNAQQPGTVIRPQEKKTSSSPNLKLITDTNKVLGGNKKCIEYIERRIPWQIMYPMEPNLIKRTACVFTPNKPTPTTLDLVSNTWVVGGQFDFIVVKPLNVSNVKIEFNSHGWWAMQKPFRENKNNLNPRLNVCGKVFTNSLTSSNKIVFTGNITEVFCKAEFITETFIPAKLGEGSDTRSLGADIYSISITPM